MTRGGLGVTRGGLVTQVTGPSPRIPGEAQVTYARTPVPGQPADPWHNRLAWHDEVRPVQPGAAVPPGCLLVKMANAQAVSTCNTVPGQVLALPDAEARALLRQGLAREVRTG